MMIPELTWEDRMILAMGKQTALEFLSKMHLFNKKGREGDETDDA